MRVEIAVPDTEDWLAMEATERASTVHDSETEPMAPVLPLEPPPEPAA